jgi:hypothetical protein
VLRTAQSFNVARLYESALHWIAFVLGTDTTEGIWDDDLALPPY